jgi:SprB repeat
MRVPITGLLLLSGLAVSAQALTLTLTPSNHNGFDVSCYGGGDGAIDLSVTGGTPPYSYRWTSGQLTEDVSDLVAGFYEVTVNDVNMVYATANITLREPEMLGYDVAVYEYPSGYNISCFNCYNGGIQVTPLGGVGPYTYLWTDASTQEDRTGLGSGNYAFDITDANGCITSSSSYYLSEPERNDWTMNGNAGTNPATQYIGTSDNKDVVFKTNGTESLRLLATGELKAPDLASSSGYSLLAVDGQGMMKRFEGVAEGDVPVGCPASKRFPWTLCGNELTLDQFIGSLNAAPLVFKTDNEMRMIISTNGKVGIGTTPPPGAVGEYRLFVEDGISTRDVLVKTGVWPDYVFDPRYELMPMDELRSYLGTNQHLPGIPSAADVAAKNGVEVGDLQAKMLKVIEEQALYILQLEERLKAVEQRTKVLEASK